MEFRPERKMFEILSILFIHPEGLCKGEVARESNGKLDESNVHENLGVLAKRGLVQERSDGPTGPLNASPTRYYITNKGKKYLIKAEESDNIDSLDHSVMLC